MIGHITPIRTGNGVSGALYDRQEELEQALFSALKMLHKTNVSKKDIADEGRKLLGFFPGEKLPERYDPTDVRFPVNQVGR